VVGRKSQGGHPARVTSNRPVHTSHPGGAEKLKGRTDLKDAYEEEYMRECIFLEDTPCSMRRYCECYSLTKRVRASFCRRVLCDARAASARNTNVRSLSTKTGTDALLSSAEFWPHDMLQSHGNISDMSGEYHSSAMLVLPTHGPVHCLSLPVTSEASKTRFCGKENGTLEIIGTHTLVAQPAKVVPLVC